MALAGLKTAGNVVAEILMVRAARKNDSVLLVEGDDDSLFWRSRIAQQRCFVVIAGGKPTVQASMLRLAAARIQGALGVVDDDCDSLEGRAHDCINVIRTGSHDVETMLLKSSAFEKVLVEYGKDSKLAALEEQEGCSVSEALARRALLFGKLRWLAVRNAWSVPFEKKFSPWRFADPAVWQFDQDDLYASFAAEVLGISPEDVAGLVSALPKADPWAIIQGHDAITILAIGLRTVLGSVQISDTNLAKALRLAFDVAAFRSTALHDSVMAWQLTNQPYVIL